MGNLGNWLKSSGFVVGENHADQPCFWRDDRRGGVESNNAVRIDGQRIEPVALFQKVFSRLDDALMFDGRDDQLLCGAFFRRSYSQNGQIVRFRSAAREDQPVGLETSQIGPQKSGDSLPCLL
jgi:hypothetical protein